MLPLVMLEKSAKNRLHLTAFGFPNHSSLIYLDIFPGPNVQIHDIEVSTCQKKHETCGQKKAAMNPTTLAMVATPSLKDREVTVGFRALKGMPFAI